MLKKLFSRTRQSRKNGQVHGASRRYLTLEPRTLLAGGQTFMLGVPDLSYPHEIVANYRDDFGSPHGTDWGFHWNAPGGWDLQGGNSGDLAQGHLRQTGLFRDLNYTGGRYLAGSWNSRAAWPANFLHLDETGGHVGAHQLGENAHDRFAIVSFPIEKAGFYSIVDSVLTKPLGAGDGLEVKVWVGNDPVDKNVTTEAGHSYSVDFDTNLGFVGRGETIYIAVGAGETHVSDHFEWDFSIARFDGTLVADYQDDFGASHSRWRYYWNSPSNWNPGDELTLHQQYKDGRIGDVASYRELEGIGTLTPDGNLRGQDNIPASFLRLTSFGGMVGASVNETNSFDRFAISAFEISDSGFYAITNSKLKKIAANGNGLELLIHNSQGETLFQKLVAPLETVSFDSYLGYLPKGETVYVAVGGNWDHTADVFELDFTIVEEPMIRTKPVKDFSVEYGVHVDQFGAKVNDGKDDQQAIQKAIDAAADIQALTGKPVLVQLGVGTYQMGVPGAENLVFSKTKNLIFQGVTERDTRLLFTEYDAAGFRIADSENLIFRDFTIDYASLPFTQGAVLDVVDRDSLIVQVDEGFRALDDAAVFGQGTTSHRTQFLRGDRSGRLLDGERFEVADLDSIQKVSERVYEVSYRRPLPEGLAVGDAWYQIARINDHGNFNLFRNDGFITIANVTSFAGPSSFVQGQGNDAVNVIDARVDLKDDRLVSVLGDGVHASRNRTGVWVEGSTFIGLSDDSLHVYRLETDFLNQQLAPNRFSIHSNRDLNVGERVMFYRDDGYRHEAKISAINEHQLITDRAIVGFDDNTRLVPWDRATRGSVIRDNVMARHRAGFGSIIVWSPHTTILGNEFSSINTHAIATNAYQPSTLSDGLIVQGNRFDDIGFSSFLGERNWAAVEIGVNTSNNFVLDNVFGRLFGDAIEDESRGTHFEGNQFGREIDGNL